MSIKNIVILSAVVGLVAGPVYAKNDKDKGGHLPPGLQMKAAQGKPLPPGWQKKLAKGQVMDADVYQQGQVVVPLDSKGLVTVRIEGKLVKLYQATREIVEVLE